MLIAVVARLDRVGVRWIVTGSAARALLGSEERPKDLDIEVAGVDADRAAASLGLTLARDTSNGWVSDRALGQIAGVAIDVSASVAARGRPPDEAETFSSAISVGLGSMTVRVMSPDARGRRKAG